MTVAQAARVDARRMLCDQAVMAAARAIRGLPPGGRLEVLTASDSVRGDLRAWADRLGHLRGPERPGEAPGEVILTIEKRRDARRR
ncbi:MAG TPA: sulfurtransferase TusA family protein [Thermodesulfobacteriota bacterium]